MIAIPHEIVWVLIILATQGITLFHLSCLGVGTWLRRFRGHSPARPATRPIPRASLAFLVAAYNEERTIEACVEALLAQSVPADEIIIVNDASTDGTLAALARFQARGVTVISLPQNGGKARAIEQGLKHVLSDLVAITDADSIVDPHYVREILPAFGDLEVSAAAGLVESLPQSMVTAARQVEYTLVCRLAKPAETMIDALLVLPGVSTTYRRRVLRDMGFERDTIAEDIDLTFRLHAKGHKMVLCLKAIVRTSDPLTLRDYHRQLLRWETDFWITVLKHRALVGKGAFGTVGFPLVAVSALSGCLLILGVPIYLLLVEPDLLPYYIVAQIAWDVTLATFAAAVVRRWDVLGASFTRFPTRIIGRVACITALARVAAGVPRKRWVKVTRAPLT